MSLNFPEFPVLNQTYLSGGVRYQWTGSKWKRLDTLSTSDFVENTNIGLYSGNTIVLDTERYNYHKIDLTTNATVSISNTAMYSSSTVQVSIPYSPQLPYDLTLAKYDNVSIDLLDTAPYNVTFKPDGTIMYYAGTATNRLYQCTLGVPWSISSITATSNSAVLTTYSTAVEGLAFSPDGTRIYFTNRPGGTIISIGLGTPWAISTLNTTGFGSYPTTSPISLAFSLDGTRLFVLSSTGIVSQYNLSTPWVPQTSVSAGTYTITQEGVPRSITFNPDGSKMYVVGDNGAAVYQYSLSTPWSIVSGVTFDGYGSRFSVASQTTLPRGIALIRSQNKMYITTKRGIVGVTGKMFQYTAYSPGYTIDWPPTIKWASGSAPAIVDVGGTVIFNLTNYGTSKLIGSTDLIKGGV